MSARLRLATPDDADALAAILSPLVRETSINFADEPLTTDQMRERIAGASELPWIVAEADGQVLGYTFARLFSPMPGERWTVESGIGLGVGARGRGLGVRMYTTLLAVLAAQGYRNAIALVTQPNPASEALHARCGFRRIGVIERTGYKLGRWHDVAWWQKRLGDPATAPGAITPVRDVAHLLRGT